MTTKTVVNITCLECGFEGKLSFDTNKFYPADICCCPICGNDISNYDDDDDRYDEDDIYSDI